MTESPSRVAIVTGAARASAPPWRRSSPAAKQLEAAVAKVAEELGAPTVLVNNAGITRDNLIFKMTEQDWDSVLGVHLKGSFLMTRAVQTFQTKEKWGRIVNLSSTFLCIVDGGTARRHHVPEA